jgi:hypothetical protein
MSRGNVMVHGGSGPVVRDVMTRAVRSIRPGATLWEAAEQMQRSGVNRLPVVDEDGALVGIVSRADIVRLVGRSDAAIRAEVLAAIGTIEEETASQPVVGLEVSVDDGIVTIRGLATVPWVQAGPRPDGGAHSGSVRRERRGIDGELPNRVARAEHLVSPTI